jgi:hypothetical protein
MGSGSSNWSAGGKRKLAWIVLLLATAGALAMVIAPVIIIFPFRAQTPDGLRMALTLRQWSPIAAPAASILVVLLMVFLWRGSRWWRKALLVIVFLLTLPPVWFARQNHFEWMFNPLVNPSYAGASEADFIDNTDYVIAVELNGDAAAYPIRQLAYHHVVHDSVGGVPIVVTY